MIEQTSRPKKGIGPLRMAIVGSDPSGFYAVDALLQSDLDGVKYWSGFVGLGLPMEHRSHNHKFNHVRLMRCRDAT